MESFAMRTFDNGLTRDFKELNPKDVKPIIGFENCKGVQFFTVGVTHTRKMSGIRFSKSASKE